MTTLPDAWREAHRTWLEGARPHLQRRDWKEAFSTYPRIEMGPPPFRELDRPLATSRITLISSCGLSLPGQDPFDEQAIFGDDSFRAIPAEGAIDRWRIDHDHYDRKAALQDYETVFPRESLRRLRDRGVLGSLAPRLYTFMGYQPDPRSFLEGSVREMIGLMREDGVDAALLVPV